MDTPDISQCRRWGVMVRVLVLYPTFNGRLAQALARGSYFGRMIPATDQTL